MLEKIIMRISWVFGVAFIIIKNQNKIIEDLVSGKYIMIFLYLFSGLTAGAVMIFIPYWIIKFYVKKIVDDESNKVSYSLKLFFTIILIFYFWHEIIFYDKMFTF